ncbi:hypothetical protein [Antarcticirhabdus aurantiaca]|uniref:hypothetical protein n=1 Tax=Antarcticirhabdus aurantiaca TaxID=2606717 RepID=UPI00131D50E4|nr:hypothetical protein [Antarcticirhabdus aurantiaca]
MSEVTEARGTPRLRSGPHVRVSYTAHVAERVRELHDEGSTAGHIRARTGVSLSEIARILGSCGRTPRTAPPSRHAAPIGTGPALPAAVPAIVGLRAEAPAPPARSWSPAELTLLKTLIDAGISIFVVAEILDRTPGAVQSRVSKSGLVTRRVADKSATTLEATIGQLERRIAEDGDTLALLRDLKESRT